MHGHCIDLHYNSMGAKFEHRSAMGDATMVKKTRIVTFSKMKVILYTEKHTNRTVYKNIGVDEKANRRLLNVPVDTSAAMNDKGKIQL